MGKEKNFYGRKNITGKKVSGLQKKKVVAKIWEEQTKVSVTRMRRGGRNPSDATGVSSLLFFDFWDSVFVVSSVTKIG